MGRRKRSSESGQREIDWEAAQFARLLETPMPNGHGVRGEVLTAVLRGLFSFGRGRPCWPGQCRLAERAAEYVGGRERLSERQTREALSVLEERLGLIASYRAKPVGQVDRRTLTHYVIIWTELAAMRQRANRGATVPASTKGPPATRLDHGGDQAATCAQGEREGAGECPECNNRQDLPVDRQDLPVDPENLPVDPENLPVDPRAHYISARPFGRGKEEEGKETTTTASSSVPMRSTGRKDGTERETEWVAVAAELRAAGVGTAEQRTEELRRRGMTAETALLRVRELIRIAEPNARRFRAGVGAALGYRLRTGDWPCAVDEDVQRVIADEDSRAAREERSRYERLVSHAYRQVRANTPRGQYVDEEAVVMTAVQLGVPRAAAASVRRGET